MKKSLLFIIISMAFLFAGADAFAQDTNHADPRYMELDEHPTFKGDSPHNFEAGLGINIYGLGAVGGPSKDFGPGFHFEYRYNYSERVDVGGRLYYKYGKGTSAFTGIDSPTWGFVDNHIGLKGIADFNMRPGKSVRPYIGVGVGGAVLVTTRTTGDNSSEMFGTFGPRIGLQIWRFRVAIESDIAFNGRYGVLSPETAHSLTLSYTF